MSLRPNSARAKISAEGRPSATKSAHTLPLRRMTALWASMAASSAYPVDSLRSSTFTASYADITFDDVVRADGCANGYVSADVTI